MKLCVDLLYLVMSLLAQPEVAPSAEAPVALGGFPSLCAACLSSCSSNLTEYRALAAANLFKTEAEPHSNFLSGFFLGGGSSAASLRGVMCSSWLAPAPNSDVSVLATNPAATVGAEEIRNSYRQQKPRRTAFAGSVAAPACCGDLVGG